MNKFFAITLLLLSIFSYGQDTSKTLQSVEIVGIKNDTRYPITVTKFNTDSFKFLNVNKDPFFILEKISPSIYAQSDNGQGNGYSYMRMRGLDQTRINYNLNGIPLNEMEDQGFYFSNMPGFYNYVSSVSVERGIGSSKYGNTSIAGSVDMETQDMSKKMIEINGLIYSASQRYYNGFYSSGISKKGLALQLGGSWIQNNGFKEHSGDNGGSIYYSFGIYRKHNIIKLYGFNGFAHNQLAFLGVPMDLLKVNYKTNFNLSSDKDTFNQNFVCINWVNDKLENITFNTSGYFSNVNGHYNTFNVLYGVNSYQGGIMSNMVYQKNGTILNVGLNTNIYARYHFGSDFNGIYFPNGNDTIISRYSNWGHKEDAIAYVKANKSVGNFNLFADIQFRYVNFNINSGPTFDWFFCNPKIGFKWIKSKHQIYFNLGTAGREPTRSDMTQSVVPSGGNTDNVLKFLTSKAPLLPERVFDIETGWGYHNKFVDLNVDAYFMRIQHEYVANGYIDPASGFMVKQSLNWTIRTGIESDGKFKIKGFNLFWALQGQYNKSDSNVITFSPNFIGSCGVSYSYHGFTLGVFGQVVSPMAMSLSNPTYSKTYETLNGYLSYNRSPWTLTLKVNNMLNQKYYIPAGIGYYDGSGNYQKDPTYYVGQLISPSLSVKFRL
jgi:iron complex outermembrane receptor protein